MGTVLVTGGTGTLGRAVVERLSDKDRTRVLGHQSEAPFASGVDVVKGDLTTGRGIHEAVAGVDSIVHCASAPRNSRMVDVEGLIESDLLPWTIVRTTQFHDLVLGIIQSEETDADAAVSVPAGMRFQSIDVGPDTRFGRT